MIRIPRAVKRALIIRARARVVINHIAENVRARGRAVLAPDFFLVPIVE